MQLAKLNWASTISVTFNCGKISPVEHFFFFFALLSGNFKVSAVNRPR